jgi:hypothetical protein
VDEMQGSDVDKGRGGDESQGDDPERGGGRHGWSLPCTIRFEHRAHAVVLRMIRGRLGRPDGRPDG